MSYIKDHPTRFNFAPKVRKAVNRVQHAPVRHAQRRFLGWRRRQRPVRGVPGQAAPARAGGQDIPYALERFAADPLDHLEGQDVDQGRWLERGPRRPRRLGRRALQASALHVPGIAAERPALVALCGDAADSYFRSHYNLIAGQYRVEVGREILA